ncbi:MAG: GspE/PulE family protein [Gemmatimonadota bacterium]
MLSTTLPITESFRAEYLEYYGILPLAVENGELRVAAAGNPSREVLDDLATTFGATPTLIDVDEEEIKVSVRAIFSAAQSTDSLVKGLDLDDVVEERAGGDEAQADVRDLVNQPPVVRFVNLLIREAHDALASDIHVEVSAQGPAVRFRIDGVLVPATAPPVALYAAVVSRLKLIADLDIAERRVPQDGRIRVRLDDHDLDLRVSTVPSLFGESIVLRLLDQRAAPDGLTDLGMSSEVLDRFVRAARSPHGIVLATGPTGSGKTTTLYGALQLRDASTEKIITIEDPVEYRLSGITQVPVNRKAGMTFGAGLRALLRQDPDVIMVGEMRDQETARIAVQAAMTGHLVFSTVHTNDAASAVVRLIDLGIEPYLVAATLRSVLAQRLVRRVCGHCSSWSDQDSAFTSLSPVVDSDARFRHGAGCALCRQTGFRGRVGLFELMDVDERLRAEIARASDADKIRAVAADAGMTSMLDDARTKVLDGVTTSQEVLRAIQS